MGSNSPNNSYRTPPSAETFRVGEAPEERSGLFCDLNPFLPEDARRILAIYAATPKKYEGLCEVIPTEVLKAKRALIGRLN